MSVGVQAPPLATVDGHASTALPPAPPAPPAPPLPPAPVTDRQPAPSGHGQEVLLAQLQVCTPEARAAHTQKPILDVPEESRYRPPKTPPSLLHTTQASSWHGAAAWGNTPAPHASLGAVGTWKQE